MTLKKCIFYVKLKSILAGGTPEYCKWHIKMLRHPGCETLV